MGVPTAPQARHRLAVGYALDLLWGETQRLPDRDSKERPLRLVAELLEREGVAYALIGGVAVQLNTEDPRTTLDIHLAVLRFADVPRAALLAAGFQHTGRHEHSDNWRAPGPGPLDLRTAVRFSADDLGIADAVAHARIVELDGRLKLRVAAVADLIVLKLAAAEEPRRRSSKREHDVADVLALLEQNLELRTPALLARLRDIRLRLLADEPEPSSPASDP